VPLLEPFTNQWTRSGPADAGPLALATGTARTVTADYEHAEADFAQAHTMAESAGTPFGTAYAKLEWSVMLINAARLTTITGDEHRSTMPSRSGQRTAGYGWLGQQRDRDTSRLGRHE
jgi:hypothetical protein